MSKDFVSLSGVIDCRRQRHYYAFAEGECRSRWWGAMTARAESRAFIDSILNGVIAPAKRQFMEPRYFTELREGTLSVCRLQGYAIQHYLLTSHS